MGYSNVATPVFYVDHFLYSQAVGASPGIGSGYWNHALWTGFLESAQEQQERRLFDLNPQEATTLTEYSLEDVGVLPEFQGLEGNTVAYVRLNNHRYIMDYDLSSNMKWYTAVLNHNIAPQINLQTNSNTFFFPMYVDTLNEAANPATMPRTNILNSGGWNNGSSIFTTSLITPDYALVICNDQHPSTFAEAGFGKRIQVGSVSRGIQYTMPHSPDLNLTMNVSMDGIDTYTTSNGASISNINYTGNPLWTLHGLNNFSHKTNPYEVYEQGENDGNSNQPLHENGLDVTKTGQVRSGRKSWNLTFSYINDYDYLQPIKQDLNIQNMVMTIANTTQEM